QKWREEISELVRAGGRHVLFKQELDTVGQRLQQPMRTHAVRTPSRLNMRHDFALEPRQIRQRRQQHEEHNDNLRQGYDKKGMLGGELVHGRAPTSATGSVASGR